jgi:hypothetical protein
MAMKASDSVGIHMPSTVKANLLDDGVVDTFVSVGASEVHTRFHQLSESRVPLAQLFEKLVNKRV